jgi:signal transduction histidine kinase
MIIAGSTGDRLSAASATIEPAAFSNRLATPEPVPVPAGRTRNGELRVHSLLRARQLGRWLHYPLLAGALAILAVCALAAAGALALRTASTLAAVTLLACACVEWALAERRAAARTVARERHRMAADVHDLIMQDLSFALANARTLADVRTPTDDPARAVQASTVVSAGERALAGARSVVSELTERETDRRPIAQALEASVRIAARHTPLAFDAQRVPSWAPLDQPTRNALVHIAREAVTNAVKHARASTVEVVLERGDRWRLTVRDDGRGFDEAPAGGGFGLLSMRQSAHALGGAVHVGRGTGGGTTVEAVLP